MCLCASATSAALPSENACAMICQPCWHSAANFAHEESRVLSPDEGTRNAAAQFAWIASAAATVLARSFAVTSFAYSAAFDLYELKAEMTAELNAANCSAEGELLAEALAGADGASDAAAELRLADDALLEPSLPEQAERVNTAVPTMTTTNAPRFASMPGRYRIPYRLLAANTGCSPAGDTGVINPERVTRWKNPSDGPAG